MREKDARTQFVFLTCLLVAFALFILFAVMPRRYRAEELCDMETPFKSREQRIREEKMQRSAFSCIEREKEPFPRV